MSARTAGGSRGRARRTIGALGAVVACVGFGIGGGVGLKWLLVDRGDETPGASPLSPGTSPSATPSGSSTSPGAATPSGVPTAAGGAGFDIAVSGDLLIHQPVGAAGRRNAHGSGYDFAPLLAPIRPLISGAALGLCHVETPISADNKHLSGYPTFWVPRELGKAIKQTGWDGCSTASNHTLDQGTAGIASTLQVLDSLGIGHTGSARTQAESTKVQFYLADGVKVAHLSYAYGFNGFQPQPGRAWSVNKIQTAAILAQAHRARQLGAQLVVVSLHWGVEYHSAPTADQLKVAQALTASDDVDLIVGHHAHVLQPIRTVNGKLVVFGLGNLLSGQSARAHLPAATQDGAVVLIHVAPTAATTASGAPRYGVTSYRAVLTVVEQGSFRVQPAAKAATDPASSATLRRDARAALAREVKVDKAYGSGAVIPVRR